MTATLLEVLRPLIDASRGLDLSDARAAEASLEAAFPAGGSSAAELNAKLVEALEAGEIANRGELPVRFSRIVKAGPETDGFSIDAVLMTGAGPLHLHPEGEIDYCIALEGEPRFDDRDPGWVVLPAGSKHVPTVTGGKMLILYLLPGGSIEFLEAPASGGS